MNGFMDMTFCTAKDCRDFGRCFRSLTPEIREQAKLWWGATQGEPPICTFVEPKKMTCYMPPKPEHHA